jgi:hypothetical protein
LSQLAVREDPAWRGCEHGSKRRSATRNIKMRPKRRLRITLPCGRLLLSKTLAAPLVPPSPASSLPTELLLVLPQSARPALALSAPPPPSQRSWHGCRRRVEQHARASTSQAEADASPLAPPTGVLCRLRILVTIFTWSAPHRRCRWMRANWRRSTLLHRFPRLAGAPRSSRCRDTSPHSPAPSRHTDRSRMPAR